MELISLPTRARSNEYKEQQTLSPVLKKKKELMLARFGDRQKFLQAFNPDLQIAICKDVELCLFGDAPTLAELNVFYGEMTATIWLVPQLYDLSEFCGCKNKLEDKQLEQCASVIAAEYSYLKVSEIMLFLHKFKSGRYGRFYGSVDPITITTSLRDFIRERNVDIERYQKEIERKADEESRKKSITYDEYCRRYKLPIKKNPIEDFLDNSKKRRVKSEQKYDISLVREIAQGLVDNVDKVDEETLALMKNVFKKTHRMTPEEFLEKVIKDKEQ